MNTLLLNAFSIPVGVVPWQRAVMLMLDGNAELVTAYPDRRVRTVTDSVPWPAVVRDRTRLVGIGLSPNRPNVIARDRHRCLYCGVEPRTRGGRPNADALTIDHVIPRCQAEYGYVEAPWRGGELVPVGDWENLATACQPCNCRKGGRTPAEAGMDLLSLPTTPGLFTSIRIVMSRSRVIPTPWEPYLSL